MGRRYQRHVRTRSRLRPFTSSPFTWHRLQLLLFSLRPSVMHLIGHFINGTQNYSLSQNSTKQIMFSILTGKTVRASYPSLSLPYISLFDHELPPSSRTALPTPFVPPYCPSAMTAIGISTFQHAYPKVIASESRTSGVLHVDV